MKTADKSIKNQTVLQKAYGKDICFLQHCFTLLKRNFVYGEEKPKKITIYLNPAGGKIKVKNNTKFNKNITLYAKWEK